MSPPNCSIGGPCFKTPGFPIKAFGNDVKCSRVTCGCGNENFFTSPPHASHNVTSVCVPKSSPLQDFPKCHPRIVLSGVHASKTPGFPIEAFGNDVKCSRVTWFLREGQSFLRHHARLPQRHLRVRPKVITLARLPKISPLHGLSKCHPRIVLSGVHVSKTSGFSSAHDRLPFTPPG